MSFVTIRAGKASTEFYFTLYQNLCACNVAFFLSSTDQIYVPPKKKNLVTTASIKSSSIILLHSSCQRIRSTENKEEPLSSINTNNQMCLTDLANKVIISKYNTFQKKNQKKVFKINHYDDNNTRKTWNEDGPTIKKRLKQHRHGETHTSYSCYE